MRRLLLSDPVVQESKLNDASLRTRVLLEDERFYASPQPFFTPARKVPVVPVVVLNAESPKENPEPVTASRKLR